MIFKRSKKSVLASGRYLLYALVALDNMIDCKLMRVRLGCKELPLRLMSAVHKRPLTLPLCIHLLLVLRVLEAFMVVCHVTNFCSRPSEGESHEDNSTSGKLIINRVL